MLLYDLDETVNQRYEEVVASFDAMAACGGKWHIEAGGAVQDLTTWKRNAGATHLVRKKSAVLTYHLPRVLKSNVTPPALQLGRKVIYFLPDVALIKDGTRIGSVGYKDLQIAWQNSNFVEEGRVPHDAEVVDYAWKHPNKGGGPDRRFNNNYQIPVCCYEVMHLTSENGLNELVEFSRTDVTRPFATALRNLPKQAVLKDKKVIAAQR